MIFQQQISEKNLIYPNFNSIFSVSKRKNAPPQTGSALYKD